MIENEEDNAVRFIDWMCSEGVSFLDTCKRLGQFAAMLTFLRFFEKWLTGRAAGHCGAVDRQTTNTPSTKLLAPWQIVDALEGCRDLNAALLLFRNWGK